MQNLAMGEMQRRLDLARRETEEARTAASSLQKVILKFEQ